MKFEASRIPDVVVITPKKFGDDRGYFMEVFRQEIFDQNVGEFRFVQDNQSMSQQVGTVRGLHFQLEPKTQGKLVACIAGALLDVAVDLRSGSPTFGQHVAVELTPDNATQLWCPPGFAHGFCTLAPNTVISYKVTNYYSAAHDRGLAWDDPMLGIDWPVEAGAATLSDKDRQQPRLAELGEAFVYRK